MADLGFVDASILFLKHLLYEASMTHSASVGHLVVNEMQLIHATGSWIVWDFIGLHIPVQ